MKKIFFLLAAATMMFAACNPDQKEEAKAATVELSPGDVTTSSVTFTVTSANATAVAYICVEGAAPAAEKVLTDGKAVEANTAAPVTVNDLKDGVEYTIVAAAMNDLGTVVSEPLKMTTVEIPANPQVVIDEVAKTDNSYTISITPSDATKCAYKVYAVGAEASANDILANGTEVSAGEASEVTIAGLEDGEYFVVAAAEKKDKSVMSEKLSFTVSNLEVWEVTVDNVKGKPYPNYGDTTIVFYYYCREDGTGLSNVSIDFLLDDTSKIPAGTYDINGGGIDLSYTNVSDEDAGTFVFLSGTVVVDIVDNQYSFSVNAVVQEGNQFTGEPYEDGAMYRLILNWTGEVNGYPVI